MSAPNVLIVDDNKGYREAFKRNLMLQGYDVADAADSAEALERLSKQEPDVVVTDLAMNQPTEGLELIRQVRALRPHLPIIMISAVGTFEEGAEASRLGARQVISKSKIDEEMSSLFEAIDQAYAEHQRSREAIGRMAEALVRAGEEPHAAVADLTAMAADPTMPDSVKAVVYDQILTLTTDEQMQTAQRDLAQVQGGMTGREVATQVERNLTTAIPHFAKLQEQTQEALRTAEFLFLHGERLESGLDFSRSIGFQYSFAVENETKFRLKKRLTKFFGDEKTPRLVHLLLEDNKRKVSLFFHQHLLRIQRTDEFEFTPDNVYQTFQRILEHGGKYKPDGLKALAIVLVCFGRTYEFRKFNQTARISNPLGMRGFESDQQLLRFASLLTKLQHYRNPYIHPEISEMTKLPTIRETCFDCMRMTAFLG